MPLSTLDATRLFAKVEALGGTVPPDLKRLVNLETRIRAISTAQPSLPVGDAAALSDDDLDAFLHESAATLKIEEARRDMLQQFEVQVPAALVAAFKGPAGDALFKSLQKVAKKHVDALDRVADQLPEEVTAEQVIALGDKAAAAWREGPIHARALDDLLHQVVLPIASEVVVDNLQHLTHGLARFVVFMADLSTRPDPDHLANRYSHGRAMRSRFGGWRALQTVTAIRLNTPAEVVAYLAEINDEKAETLKPKTYTMPDRVGVFS